MVGLKNFGVATLFCVFLVAAADYFGPSKGHPYYEAYSRILDAGVIGGVSAFAIWLLILMISAPFLFIAHFKNKSGEPKEKESFHKNLLKISNPTENPTKKSPFCGKKIMASTIKCKLYSEMMSGQFKAAPVIENILSPALPNLNVQPENKEKAKYDVTDLLEAKKLEN
jgi:hypothetical protein